MHFSKVLNIRSQFEEEMLESVRQREVNKIIHWSKSSVVQTKWCAMDNYHHNLFTALMYKSESSLHVCDVFFSIV